MLYPVTGENKAAFEEACGIEHVFGSKILCSFGVYGASPAAKFWLGTCPKGLPAAALFGMGGVLVIASSNEIDPASIAGLVQEEGYTEIDTNWAQCEALQAILGGSTESSYYMVYSGGPIPGDYAAIEPAGDLQEVFTVLQQSHEYYRTHLQYAPWAQDIEAKCAAGLMEVYLQRDEAGAPIATGSILSMDGECGVLGAVAVIPQHRHKGLGQHMSSFLTNRVLDMGKTPRLISGYDAVANLYRRVGYTEVGRWGELYL